MSVLNPGPITEAAKAVFNVKYAQRGETYRDVVNRVASTLSDNERHFRALKRIMEDGRFWPGGRILSNIGTTKTTTPYNCFVSGPIRDTYVSGEGSIMQRATEAAATLRMGGGIGYDFSTIRPRGDKITKIDGMATGPISFMDIYNAVGKCTSSTGQRRGAQMGILRVDHPDIEEFIRAKQNTNQLNAFNISIAITDQFMQAVIDDEEFPLQFGGKVYRTINAQMLWDQIMRSTWDWGEPGVIFIDTVNRMNNLSYCETIYATNPCSEQPLPPFGACLLGYMNMTKYVQPLTVTAIHDAKWRFDRQALAEDIPHVIRSLDNVVDVATYPLPEQEDEAKSKRRMGLGVMGMANALEACGLEYGSPAYVAEMENILELMANVSYMTSAQLAREKGAFPLYDARYLEAPFIKKLAPVTQEMIREHGIRNSHLTSIAPTGTTSFCADNVSSGIEPVWDYETKRVVEMPDGPVVMEVEDYGVRVFGVKGKKALDIGAREHIAVLVAAQRWIDSAISKTCNVPANMDWHEFKSIYSRAWRNGAKGCATFTTGGKRAGILEGKPKPVTECEGLACQLSA